MKFPGKIFFLYFIITMCYVSPAYSIDDEVLISLDSKNLTLTEIAKQIYSQSGYTIAMDDDLKNTRMSFEYTNIPLNNFLSRVLQKQKQNYLISTNETHKLITIHRFGKNTHSNLSPTNHHKYPTTDPMTDKSYNDLKVAAELHKKTFSDPNKIDPMTGNSYGYLRKKAELHQKTISDPNTIDPMTGNNYGELKIKAELHQKIISDPNTIDPMTGNSYGELKIEAEVHQKNLPDPAITPPMSHKNYGD